jgi:hypothetical protein
VNIKFNNGNNNESQGNKNSQQEQHALGVEVLQGENIVFYINNWTLKYMCLTIELQNTLYNISAALVGVFTA